MGAPGANSVVSVGAVRSRARAPPPAIDRAGTVNIAGGASVVASAGDVVVADSRFAALEWLAALPKTVHVVTRLRLEAAL